MREVLPKQQISQCVQEPPSPPPPHRPSRRASASASRSRVSPVLPRRPLPSRCQAAARGVPRTRAPSRCPRSRRPRSRRCRRARSGLLRWERVVAGARVSRTLPREGRRRQGPHSCGWREVQLAATERPGMQRQKPTLRGYLEAPGGTRRAACRPSPPLTRGAAGTARSSSTPRMASAHVWQQRQERVHRPRPQAETARSHAPPPPPSSSRRAAG